MKFKKLPIYAFLVLILLCSGCISTGLFKKNKIRKSSEKGQLMNNYFSSDRNIISRRVKTMRMESDGVEDNPLDEIVVSGLIALQLEDSYDDDTKCPFGYEFVKDRKFPKEPADLNYGARGKYIYLCVAKDTFGNVMKNKGYVYNHLSVTESTCHENYLDRYARTDDINLGAKNGTPLYICMGYSNDRTVSPLYSVSTYTVENEKSSAVYSEENCLSTNLNPTGSWSIYLCFGYNHDAPTRMEVSDFKVFYDQVRYSFDNASKVNYSLNEYKVEAGTWHELGASGKISVSKSTRKAFSIKNLIGNKLDIGHGFTRGNFGLQVNVDYGTEDVKTTYESEENETNNQCSATAKFINCILGTTVTKLSIPYTFKYSYYTDKDIFLKTFGGYGEVEEVSSTNISSSSCCYNNCDDKDKICDFTTREKALKKPTPQQPTCNFNTPRKLNVSESQKNLYTLRHFQLENSDLVIDIKFVHGSQNVDCTNDYIKVDYDLLDGRLNRTYSYLCIRKEKISNLIGSIELINVVVIQYNNSNCGDLKPVTTFTDENDTDVSVGNRTYICFGRLDYSRGGKYPVSDIVIKNNKTDAILSSTENNTTWDVSQDIGLNNGSSKFLYFERKTNVPVRVEIMDFRIEKYQNIESHVPIEVDELRVVGSKITKEYQTTLFSQTSEGFNILAGGSLKVSKAGFWGFSKEHTRNFGFGESNKEEKDTANTITQTVTCEARPESEVRCSVRTTSIKSIITYSYVQVFYDIYDKALSRSKLTGTSITEENGSLSVRSCCQSNCCAGNESDRAKPHCWNSKTSRPIYNIPELTCDFMKTCDAASYQAYKTSEPISVTIGAEIQKLPDV